MPKRPSVVVSREDAKIIRENQLEYDHTPLEDTYATEDAPQLDLDLDNGIPLVNVAHPSIFPVSALETAEIEIPLGALDEQVGGDHYKDCKIQPLEYAYANDLNVCEHAIVKYITRHRKKGQVQDLEKVIHYARLEAKLTYGEDI